MNQTSVLLSQILTPEYSGVIKTKHYELSFDDESNMWTIFKGKKHVASLPPENLEAALEFILAQETALKTS